MFHARQKELVRSTIPAVQKHREEITRVFYTQLLGEHPELRPMFNTGDQETGEQARRLAAAILAYVGNLDRLDLLGKAVTRISETHVKIDVRPEQYPVVGEHFLRAIQSVLGEAATPEILEAWGAAYEQLAAMTIEREAQMYREPREKSAEARA